MSATIKIVMYLLQNDDIRKLLISILSIVVGIFLIGLMYISNLGGGNISSSDATILYPPVNPLVINAPFGTYDPDGDGESTEHRGVDYGGYFGQDIYSAQNGEVISIVKSCADIGYYGSQCGGGYGNHIVIESSTGSITIYGHLSEVDVVLHQEVSQGFKIGEMGSSGSSTGTHLHFGYSPTISQNWIDPTSLIMYNANYTSAYTLDEKREILNEAGLDDQYIYDNILYIDYIFTKESSWNYLAENNSSGAYGICQALPPDKMSSEGDDYLTNISTQIKWCNSYAIDRYGSWEEAYNFWIANNWW